MNRDWLVLFVEKILSHFVRVHIQMLIARLSINNFIGIRAIGKTMMNKWRKLFNSSNKQVKEENHQNNLNIKMVWVNRRIKIRSFLKIIILPLRMKVMQEEIFINIKRILTKKLKGDTKNRIQVLQRSMLMIMKASRLIQILREIVTIKKSKLVLQKRKIRIKILYPLR